MKNTTSIFLLCLSMAQLPSANLFGQEKRDPFSTSDATVRTSTPADKSKTIIHVDTLEHCIDWIQISYAIANMKAEIDQCRDDLKPDAKPEATKRTETRITNLLNRITEARRELDRIPLTTTFDFQRFEQFKHELKHFESTHYEQIITPRLLAAARIRELEQENQKLRQKIRDLESNK